MVHLADDRLAEDEAGIRSVLKAAETKSASQKCACANCPLNVVGLCMTANSPQDACAKCSSAVSSLKATEHTAPARRLVWHPKEWSEYVPVVCKGWAASSITLANGDRQILSFLLPGDILSTASLFGSISSRSVEAITEVTYRKYRRDDIKDLMQRDSDFFDRVSRTWVHEREQADNLLVDLGRRTADARVARLLLYLAEALANRNMLSAHAMPFPLRHRHIADATGMTSNHAAKTLGLFQRLGLIEIMNRSLTITNGSELRHIAAWQ